MTAHRQSLRILTSIAVLLTVGLASRMVQCLCLSVTSVLVRDQWFMLDELLRLHQGKVGIAYLWEPYWGQRIVIPRLLFWLDERFFHFSNVPLVAINVTAQCTLCATLILVAWRALRDHSVEVKILLGLAIANLCFSSLQMENFVYGMAIEYTLGCFSAMAALVLLGYSTNSRMRLVLAIAAALFCTLTSAAGLLLWPIFIAEAVVLRASRKTVALLAALFGCLGTAYAIGFVSAAGGMTVIGLARHPLSGILIAAMILGGPLSVFNSWLGQAAGLFGMAVVVYLIASLFCRVSTVSRERVMLTSLACLFVEVAFSIVIGRVSPEFVAALKGLAPVSGRYFTFCFLFWAALLPAILAIQPKSFVRPYAQAATMVVVVGLTAGTAFWQLKEDLDWVAFTRQLEAAASSFYVGADDPENTAIIFPDQQSLDHWIPYLREHHLADFANSKAAWIGQPVSLLIPSKKVESCQASLDKPLENGRVTGKIARSLVSRYGGTDIVFSGRDGRVVGMGRTFFRTHEPLPEFEYFFLGYVQRPIPTLLTAWSLGKRVCRFSEE